VIEFPEVSVGSVKAFELQECIPGDSVAHRIVGIVVPERVEVLSLKRMHSA
jgi:hypothetical protein